MVYYFYDFLSADIFQNPEVVAVAIGALAFIISFVAASKMFQKGISIIISAVIGFTAGWYLYTNQFSWEFNLAGIAVGIAALGIIFLLVRAFFRFGKRRFGHG